MRLLIFILLLLISLSSCRWCLVEEVNLTGVCYDKEAYDYDGSLVPIMELTVSTGCPCNFDKIYYTDENGRFNVKQCFEDVDNDHSFAMTIGTSLDNWGVYKPRILYYVYHEGHSVIDMGDIFIEKY